MAQSDTSPSLGCQSSCGGCQLSDRNFCTTCQTSLFVYQGSCVQSCPTGTWMNRGRCELCMKNCSRCSNGSSCTTCNGNLVSSEGQCVEIGQCLSTTANFINNGVCSACKLPCKSCQSDGKCTQCPGNLFLLDGICSDICPIEFAIQANTCYPQSSLQITFQILRTFPCTYL